MDRHEAMECRRLVHELFDEEIEASEVVERMRGVVIIGAQKERVDLPYRADIDG